MAAKGQAIVEFALTLPIFLFLVLGGGELAFLVASQFSYQRGADLLAEVAAERIAADPNSWRGGWNSIVRDENDLRNCGDDNPDVDFPEGQLAGGRVRVNWACFYRPRITTMWDGLSLTVIGEAVIRPNPSPPPAASPSTEP